MTLMLTPPLALDSPERMAIISEHGQEAWREFASAALTAFEGSFSGHRELFQDEAVITQMIGSVDCGMTWPGHLLTAMHSRGYDVASSVQPEAHYSSGHGEMLSDAPGRFLSREAMDYIKFNLKYLSPILNVSVTEAYTRLAEETNVVRAASRLRRAGWAVLLTHPDTESHQTFVPGDKQTPNMLRSMSPVEVIMYAVKHKVYRP